MTWRATRAGMMGAAAGGAGGAFPVWNTADDTSGQGNGQNFTAVYPANAAVDDLIVLAVATNTSSEVTTPSGFSVLAGWSGNFQRIRAYWRRYDGTEPADFTVTMSSTQYRAWRLIRVSGAHITSDPEGSGEGNTGNSTAPDPTAVSPSWGAEKNLFLIFGSFDGAASVSDYPTNYVNGITNGTTEQLSMASRQLEASTEDPGAWTLSESATWVVNPTASIRPAA